MNMLGMASHMGPSPVKSRSHGRAQKDPSKGRFLEVAWNPHESTR